MRGYSTIASYFILLVTGTTVMYRTYCTPVFAIVPAPYKSTGTPRTYNTGPWSQLPFKHGDRRSANLISAVISKFEKFVNTTIIAYL
jgi:hypothetical protein